MPQQGLLRLMPLLLSLLPRGGSIPQPPEHNHHEYLHQLHHHHHHHEHELLRGGGKCAKCPHHSDVVATSRSAHYTIDHGTYDTWGAMEAFHATRLDWVRAPSRPPAWLLPLVAERPSCPHCC